MFDIFEIFDCNDCKEQFEINIGSCFLEVTERLMKCPKCGSKDISKNEQLTKDKIKQAVAYNSFNCKKACECKSLQCETCDMLSDRQKKYLKSFDI